MNSDELADVRSRLPNGAAMVDDADHLEFVDPHGLRWQLTTDRDFFHAGDIADRWVDV